jgi:alkanesulfonate monooxygenase SsuD/methylene tetrahydromethanopterin reductase-like flavin-dependent oxidoreductase (luciferase family)
VALAKSMAAIDFLSGGRLIVGVGPGSSARDYDAVGVPFEERWKRLDEAVEALRALWRGDGPPFEGAFYSTTGIVPEPRPLQRPGPPIWIGSWGSEAGLRRTARLGDGWLASAYNTTPEAFADAGARLGERLRAAGEDPDRFPNAIATTFLYVTGDHAEADLVLPRYPRADARAPRTGATWAPPGRPRRRVRREARRLPIGGRAAHHALARTGRASPVGEVPGTGRTPGAFELHVNAASTNYLLGAFRYVPPSALRQPAPAQPFSAFKRLAKTVGGVPAL